MCGCNKKEAVTTFKNEDVTVWGPLYWKILHTLAENVGVRLTESQDEIIALKITKIVNDIPNALPCSECQLHAQEYIRANPVNFNGLTRTALRDAVRLYLYTFHNSVRTSKGQPIIVALTDLETLYNTHITMTELRKVIHANKTMSEWRFNVKMLTMQLGILDYD